MHITHRNVSISLSREVFIDFNKYLVENKPSNVFFLVDENTHEHCLIKLLQELPDLERYEVLEIEPGEESKCHEILIHLYHALTELEADRKALIVNVGGGVVTDLGGFLAATFKRGISFINFPTSLLAMVDASSGGKTGVDLGPYKNQIGVFTDAVSTYINPDFLETLPIEQMRSGFAEMLKHGLIADAIYFEQLSKKSKNHLEPTDAEIWRSVEIKSGIVEQDFRESGIRKALNFGHTIGHAIEGLLLENGTSILHGEAIAQGMLAELWLSKQMCGLPEVEFEKATKTLLQFYGTLNTAMDEVRLLALMAHDKKNERGAMKFSLLKKIGEVEVNVSVSIEKAQEALRYLKNL